MKASQDTTLKALFTSYFFNLDNDVQRSYEWSENNVKRFIKDITEKDNHFIGILLTTENDGYKTIFDGQQRFTTSVLCACAIKNILNKRNFTTEYYRQTQDMLLMAINEDDEYTYKLSLREDDNDVLKKLINTNTNFSDENKKTIVYKNYNTIMTILDNYDSSELVSFYKHLLNARICELMCNDNEEGRNQFYYLNSGQVITETRRLISLLVTHTETSETLREFASTLSQTINEDDSNRLFSLFTWYHYGVPYTEKNLSLLEEDLKYNKNNICQAIYDFYIKWFEPIMINKHFTDDRKPYNFVFNNCFNYSNNNVVQLYTIAILNTDQTHFSKEKALKAMEWVVICKRCIKTTATAKTISLFFKEWDGGSDIYQYVIKKANELGFWLTPDSLIKYLRTTNEKKGDDVVKTILCRIESVSIIEQSTPLNMVTLEHIFPQKPKSNDSYDEVITPNYRLGNLTLLGNKLNSGIQNSTFINKKESYKGSCYEITRRLVKYDKWTIAEVEDTEKYYAEQLKKYYKF